MDRLRPKRPVLRDLMGCYREDTVCQPCGIPNLHDHDMKKLEDKIVDFEAKSKFKIEPRLKNQPLLAEQLTKEAHFDNAIIYTESEYEIYRKLLQNQPDIQERESKSGVSENNFKTSTKNLQILERELSSTSQKLQDSLLQMEKMKIEIENYEKLKLEYQQLKESEMKSSIMLMNEQNISETLRKTVGYLERNTEFSSRHIERLEDHIKEIGVKNEYLNKTLADANFKVKVLSRESEPICHQEEDDVRNTENIRLEGIVLQKKKEALMNKLKMPKRDNEMLFTVEENVNSQNCSLMSERERKDYEINTLTDRQTLLQQRIQETDNTLQELKVEIENLKIQFRASKEMIVKTEENEHALSEQIIALKANYESIVCQMHHRVEKQTLEFKRENENSYESLEQDFKTELDQQEKRLKLEHKTELETVEKQQKQSLIDSQQNERNINLKWNSKIIEYRDQMKLHVESLEHQLDLETQNNLMRTNQALKEQEDLKLKVEQLEMKLSGSNRQLEVQLLDKNKELSESQQEKKRMNEELEHFKHNLTEKEQIIDRLHQIVYRECAEKSDILKRLEELKHKNIVTVMNNATEKEIRSEELLQDSSSVNANNTNETNNYNVFPPRDNDGVDKKSKVVQPVCSEVEEINLKSEKSMVKTIPVNFGSRIEIHIPACLRNSSRNPTSSFINTATESLSASIGDNTSTSNISLLSKLGDKLSDIETWTEDTMQKFIVEDGRPPRKRNSKTKYRTKKKGH